VAERWRQIVLDVHLSHDGFVAAVKEYAGDDADVCEILVMHSQGFPLTAALELWRASSGHWACAMNPRYTHAAIASGWDGTGTYWYGVMWLVS